MQNFSKPNFLIIRTPLRCKPKLLLSLNVLRYFWLPLLALAAGADGVAFAFFWAALWTLEGKLFLLVSLPALFCRHVQCQRTVESGESTKERVDV